MWYIKCISQTLEIKTCVHEEGVNSCIGIFSSSTLLLTGSSLRLLIYESGTLDDKHITAEDGALERTRYVSGKLVWYRIDATLNDLFGYVRSVGTVQEMSS